MRHSFALACILMGLLLPACGSSGKTDAAPAVPKADSVVPAPVAKAMREKGVIVPAEPVAADPQASYAFYLPKAYAPDRPLPVLICFDSHARGKDPVSLYQTLADQYQLILVGSNTSKNGQQSQQGPLIYDQLWADVKAKFVVDEKRVYTCGFSGGARVAATVAQTRAGVAGVIGCAAGLAPRQGDRFPYYGIVGMEDFNYWEMDQVDRQLDQTGQPHVVRWFAGGHAWPPAEVMADGLAFLTLRNLDPADVRRDSLVAACKAQSAKADPRQHGHDRVHGAWRLQKALVATLEPFGGLEAERARLREMGADPALASAEAAMRALNQSEFAKRNEFVGHIATRSVAEWRSLAADMRAGRIPYEGRNHFSDMRILNFTSLNVYFQADGALGADDVAYAERMIDIYALVDPANPEHAYLRAILRMRQGRPADALAAIEQAESLGFKDVDRVAAQSHFDAIRHDPRFERAVQQMQD